MKQKIPATIPPLVIEMANAMFQPYGVDIAAALSRKPEPAAAVESLKKRYLTVAEAIRYCGVGRWSLWKAESEGKIKASKLNAAKCSRVLYDSASIDAWLESCQKQPKPKA